MNQPQDKPPIGPIEPGDLPLAQAPDAIWKSIEAALDAGIPQRQRSFWPAWAWAAASLAVISAVSWYVTRPSPPSWAVSSLEGSPSVDKITVGEWLQTDA